MSCPLLMLLLLRAAHRRRPLRLTTGADAVKWLQFFCTKSGLRTS